MQLGDFTSGVQTDLAFAASRDACAIAWLGGRQEVHAESNRRLHAESHRLRHWHVFVHDDVSVPCVRLCDAGTVRHLNLRILTESLSLCKGVGCVAGSEQVCE